MNNVLSLHAAVEQRRDRREAAARLHRSLRPEPDNNPNDTLRGDAA